MLVALLRFLVPDTVRATAAQAAARPNAVVVASRTPYTPPVKPTQGGRTHSKSEDILALKEDVSLLHLSWKSVIGVCPSMPAFLSSSHPYMVEILARDLNDYIFPEAESATSVPSSPSPSVLQAGDAATTPVRDQFVVAPLPVKSRPEVAVDSEPIVQCAASNDRSSVALVSPAVGDAQQTPAVRSDYGIRKIDARTHIV